MNKMLIGVTGGSEEEVANIMQEDTFTSDEETDSNEQVLRNHTDELRTVLSFVDSEISDRNAQSFEWSKTETVMCTPAFDEANVGSVH